MEIPARQGRQQASPVVMAICALVVLFAIGLRVKAAFDLRHKVLAEATILGHVFHVEIADTVAKREKGLGDRDSLAADAGMYFPFQTAQRWSFWMKGMRFPIDIVWIRDGRVVDIHHDVPVEATFPLPTYSPVLPADAVLELNAGTAEAIGLEPGDAVCLGTCPPDIQEAPAVTLEPIPAGTPATGTPETAVNASGTMAVPEGQAP